MLYFVFFFFINNDTPIVFFILLFISDYIRSSLPYYSLLVGVFSPVYGLLSGMGEVILIFKSTDLFWFSLNKSDYYSLSEFINIFGVS